MFRLLKWLLILSLVGGLCLIIWTGLALWTGYYSVYSYPPSKEFPEGATLVIERDGREPMYNSPQFIPEKRKKGEGETGGVGFGEIEFVRKKPIEPRIVFTLPYIEWAYEQSLNEHQLEKYQKVQSTIKTRK